MKTAAFASLALALSACAAREPAPAAERTYPRDADQVWAAALGAARDLELTIDAHEHDSRGGRIEARRGDGDQVRMLVRSVEPEKSVVTVHVDRQGLARLLFDRISARLGPAPRPPAP